MNYLYRISLISHRRVAESTDEQHRSTCKRRLQVSAGHLVNESIDAHYNVSDTTLASIPLSNPTMLSIIVPSVNMCDMAYPVRARARLHQYNQSHVGQAEILMQSRCRSSPVVIGRFLIITHEVVSGPRARSLPRRDTNDRTLSIIIVCHPPSNFLPPFSLLIACLSLVNLLAAF